MYVYIYTYIHICTCRHMQTKSVQICLMPTKKSMLVVWVPFHLPTFSWFRNRAMASFVGLRLKQLLSAKTVEQPTGHVVGRRGSCVFFVCGSSGNELLGEGGWLVSWLIDCLIDCLSLPCLRIMMILMDSCLHYIYTSSWNRDISSTLWTVLQQDARLNADAKVLGEIGVHYIWMNAN